MSNKYKSDASNMYQTLKDFSKQIPEVWHKKTELDDKLKIGIKSIIVSGLGGSAISGDVAYTMFHKSFKVPYLVNRNYLLPNFADSNTLVIACSYSGNTEETISAFNDAVNKGCKIICISTGGELKRLAEKNNVYFFDVPSGYQPRCANGLMLFALLKILHGLNQIEIKDEEINEFYDYLTIHSDDYSSESGLPYKLAIELIGKFPVIHSSELLSSVNTRFRCQIAENSKMLSYSGIIPELNHNEIIGWETFNYEKFPAVLIQLLDDEDLNRIKLRFEITEKILKELNLPIIKISSKAKSFKLRVLDLIYLIDWISFYLAVLRNIDPTTIVNINRLKEALAKI